MLFKTWSYLSLMTIGDRQDKYISPFCRQENRNQSGCQEMSQSRAPAIYSSHLCVPSFSIQDPGQSDNYRQMSRALQVGRRFWQWGWRAAPGFPPLRTSQNVHRPLINIVCIKLYLMQSWLTPAVLLPFKWCLNP